MATKDYRNTIYCNSLTGIKERKDSIVKLVAHSHPRAIDMHNYVSVNNSDYKNEFMKAYNYKCAYCGVSLEVTPYKTFEVDHFINEASFPKKSAAGYIGNLVLACYDCNRKKSGFIISKDIYINIYPDDEEITRTFVRDDNFYIQISPKKINNHTIVDFYEQLSLGSELHRLDYLVMNMIGFRKKYLQNEVLAGKLGEAIYLLQTKRNRMFC